MAETRDTLIYANKYMAELGKSIDKMQQIKISDKKVYEFLDELFPISESATYQQKKNILKMREDAKICECNLKFFHSCKTTQRAFQLQGKSVCENGRRQSFD